jgi:hypothetical protein
MQWVDELFSGEKPQRPPITFAEAEADADKIDAATDDELMLALTILKSRYQTLEATALTRGLDVR